MPDPANPRTEGIEPIEKWLLGAIAFFTMLLVYISKWSPNDGQTFQVVSGLVTGFAAAFLARLKPSARAEKPKPVEDVK